MRCQLEAADSAPIHLLAILCKYDMHFLLMILKLIQVTSFLCGRKLQKVGVLAALLLRKIFLPALKSRKTAVDCQIVDVTLMSMKMPPKGLLGK